jgi:hypothetical protein
VTYTLEKLVNFETDTGDWKNNVLDAGAIAFFSPWKDGANSLSYIEQSLMSGMSISHYSEKEGVKQSDCDWQPLTEDNFIGDWSTGRYGIINIMAHGWSHAISRWVWVNDEDDDGRADNDELEWKFIMDVDSNLDDDYPCIFFDMS